MTRNKKHVRISLLAAMIATGLAAAPAMAAELQVADTQPSPAAPVSDAGARLIVKYKNARMNRSLKLDTVNAAAARARAVTSASSRTAAAAPKAGFVRTLGVGADLIRLSNRLGATEMRALVRELAADPAVQYVEIDRLLQHTGIAAPQFVPNDPFFANNQWHLKNDNLGGMNATEGWDLSTGAGVVVAVLDTGIVPHADMNANMLEGYDFITDATVSRRATDDRVPGAYDYGDWTTAGDCGDPSSVASDSSWHGTHVSGTVAELTNNGLGLAGVAYNAKVLPVRVLGRCGGYTSDIVDAIVWASGGTIAGVTANANPAEVINMSLGGGQACPSTTQDAVNIAVANGTTVVVAAGNSNSDVSNFSPASCDNVVSVAAGRVTGGRAGYSNYGALIDLTAPGGGGNVDPGQTGYVFQAVNNSTTSPNPSPAGDNYLGFTGTSMASPHVAGVVAMIQSVVDAPKTPAEIEDLLKQSARGFPANPDRPIGTGLLDAKLAIDLATLPPGETPPAIELVDKVPVSGISGGADSSKLYSIEVPAGARLLNIMTYGGSGNASVYVSQDAEPTTTDFDHRSVRPGNNEVVRVSNPAAGTYFILIHGATSYANLTLQARVD